MGGAFLLPVVFGYVEKHTGTAVGEQLILNKLSTAVLH
jgi:hypothetical protein